MSGAIEGRLEAVMDGRAIGWAWDRDRPDHALEVEIEIDGRAVATGQADMTREALAEAGIGSGNYGFDIELPEELSDGASHSIRVTAGPEQIPVLPFEGFETVS